MRFFNREPKPKPAAPPPLFDDAFLRRLEKLSYRSAPWLRGHMMGERRSRNLRPALDFSDHRSYTMGDDLRHVDWNAYSRHDELFVKLGEATQRLDLHLLLDRSPSMSWRDPLATVSKWHGARQLAGALSYLGLAGGERLYITPFDQTLGESFGPTQGKRQTIRALQFITDMEPVEVNDQTNRPAVDLTASHTNYARNHPNGGLLILLSDLLDTVDPRSGEPAVEPLAEGLRYLTPPRWQVLVIHLLTAQELTPTFEGDFDLRDLETAESLPFYFDEATLAQYRLRVRRWCAELQRVCAGRGATYAQLVAEWPLEQKVLPYLRQRGVL